MYHMTIKYFIAIAIVMEYSALDNNAGLHCGIGLMMSLDQFKQSLRMI